MYSYRPLHGSDEPNIVHPAAEDHFAQLVADYLRSAKTGQLLGDDRKVAASKGQPADLLELCHRIQRSVNDTEFLPIDFKPESAQLIEIVEHDSIGIVLALGIEKDHPLVITREIKALDRLAGSGFAHDQLDVCFIHFNFPICSPGSSNRSGR